MGKAMQNTRSMVLQALLFYGELTVNQLAGLVSVKGITVRHHLNALLADGLAVADAQRQPIGRPYHIYRLTPAGIRAAQAAAGGLLGRLWRVLGGSRPGLDVATLSSRAREEFSGLSLEHRVRRLVGMLDEACYATRWQPGHATLHLVASCCPFHAVSIGGVNVCQIEQHLLEAILDAEAHRDNCVRAGDRQCSLELRLDRAASGMDDRAV
jgi:predicted ArsR family transcriptional regulator